MIQSGTSHASSEFLQVAVDIAQRLLDAAVWQGETCSWPQPVPLTPTSTASDVGATVPGGPYFYSGSAGIALFLLRLHAGLDGDDRLDAQQVMRTAQGGLRFALAAEDERPQATGGFYDGTAGFLPVLLEMEAVDPEGDWGQQAAKLGRKVAAGIERPGAYDLVAGEAGSLLGLLHWHAASGCQESLDAARALGDTLLQASRREPEGLSWDVMHPKVRRNLIGFSHGVGGIAVALLELQRWTGEARYGVAASEALRYEISMGRAADGWWPDLRHNELAMYLESGQQQKLVDALLEDRFEASSPSDAMCAWCHGAPSVALGQGYVRWVTGRDDLDASIQRAVEVTLQRTAASLEAREPPGHSLCHGVCGNLDIVLTLGRRLDRPDWVDEAASLARRCLGQVRARGQMQWVSGHPGKPPGLDLMRGDAGIGLFYLRCARPEVKDCLLPIPDGTPSHGDSPQETLSESRRQRVALEARLQHFPRTVRTLAELGTNPMTFEVATAASLPTVLAEAIDAAPLEDDALHDVLALEAAAYDLWISQLDVSKPFLADLLRPRAERLEHGETLVCLAPTCRLLDTSHDWEAMSVGGEGWTGVVRRPTTYLLYGVEQRVRLRRLAPLAATMYRLLQGPIPLGHLYDEMLQTLSANGLIESDDDDTAQAVRTKLEQILQHAFRDRMVDIVEPYDLTPSDITSDVCIRCGECCKIKIEIPGDAIYTEFAREMLEEPLQRTYPDAQVRLVPSPSTPYTSVDLGYCRHLNRGEGDDGSPCLTCGIYQRRPQTCRQFNCVSWWRRQRLMAVGPTPADDLIEKVVRLTGHRPRHEKKT